MTDLLIIQNLAKRFGSLTVIDDLSFSVHEGEILGVIGPNGAGKTTLFDLLTGSVAPDRGRILFAGRDITGLRSFKRCRLGLGRTYQTPRPFERLTVFENLMVAAVHGAGLSEHGARGTALEILALTGLEAFKDWPSARLGLAQRKWLELARAMATRPRLLLLDEIAGGLSERETDNLMRLTRELQRRGITILLIEHLMTLMAEGVDRLLVIAGGRRLECGVPAEVMRSEEVMACYLGADEA